MTEWEFLAIRRAIEIALRPWFKFQEWRHKRRLRYLKEGPWK